MQNLSNSLNSVLYFGCTLFWDLCPGQAQVATFYSIHINLPKDKEMDVNKQVKVNREKITVIYRIIPFF